MPNTEAPDKPIPTEGLPQRGAPAAEPEPRTGENLIDAAAGGEPLTPRESDDLLSYYLSNDEMPGDTDVTPLTVRLGHGARAREFACEVHAIEWKEWQDAIERSTDKATGDFDRFVSSSWVVARALVKPKLGPTVVAQQNEAKGNDDGKIAGPNGARVDPPTDAADLLRRMFRKQSGALLELSAKVLELSKLANDGERAVKEVEAGKL